MRITLIICVSYWVLLTFLLLAPNPAVLVGLRTVPNFPWGKFGFHLIAFTILGVLANASRWPKRLGWSLIVFLAIYGIATEKLQLLDPPRTCRVMDGIENLLGIALGSGIYWLFWELMRAEAVKTSGDWREHDKVAIKLERLSRIGHKRN